MKTRSHDHGPARGARAGFVLALALLLIAAMFTIATGLLKVIPTNLERGMLAQDRGRLLDIAQSGLADAEYQLLKDPGWVYSVNGSIASGSYSVIVTSSISSVVLRSTATDAAGRKLTVLREVGVGTAAFRYMVFSENLVIGLMAPTSSVKGSIYGYSGATITGCAVSGSIDTAADSGPIRTPFVDWFDYQVIYGFDETHNETPLSGDHSASRIVFVNGNCTLSQTTSPFRFRTLIVTGSLTITGSLLSLGGQSSFTPDVVNGRTLPAILCYGSITATGSTLTPIRVEGPIWCAGSVNWSNLVLRGSILAEGSVTLSGASSDLDQTGKLFWDPAVCPPYFKIDPVGAFLTRMNQQILR